MRGWGTFCALIISPFASSFPTVGAAPLPVVHWRVDQGPGRPLRPGEPFAAHVHGTIDPGWHIYTLEEPEGGPLETVLELTEGGAAELLHVDQGQPESVMDAAFGQRTTRFRGHADFALQLRVAMDAALGAGTVHILVRYQSCNDRLCLPPRTDTVTLPIVVKP